MCRHCQTDPDVMADPYRVKVKNRERISDSYLKVTRYLLKHEQYDGGWTDTLSREVMERGEVAAVLPFDPVRNEVIPVSYTHSPLPPTHSGEIPEYPT